MLKQKLLIVLLTTIGSMELAGCSGQVARSTQMSHAQATSNSADPGRNGSEASFIAKNSHHFRKDPPREAFLTAYNNPEEGISFRYPRNYSLEEGDVEEHSYFLKRQEDLEIEQPGATLVATILIPEDGYPNTTFEHGSLQMVINEAGTEQSCRETNLASSSTATLKATTVNGIVFHWSEQQSETGGINVLERSYAGYSRGTCYEFLLTIAAEDTSDLDGFRKPANTAKIMKQLEKIVVSAQTFEKSVTPAAKSSEESADRL